MCYGEGGREGVKGGGREGREGGREGYYISIKGQDPIVTFL